MLWTGGIYGEKTCKKDFDGKTEGGTTWGIYAYAGE
jgi:hypothetical protein